MQPEKIYMTEEQSFAEMLEQTYEEPVKLQTGQRINAVVVRVGGQRVFVDLGGKSEGNFAASEVADSEGLVSVKEGDTIPVYFLSANHGEMLCTTKLGKGVESQALLEEASRSGIPVQGTVDEEIKGGFAIKLAGSTRAFCPFSQIGVPRAENEEVIGRLLDFKIMKYSEKGRNIIVSHREVVEEERRHQMVELRKTLQEGMTVPGTVSSIRNFGAFIDIGGLEGLLPISEICWGHVEDINERLHVGQKVEVNIVKLDWDAERFSFSLKNTTPDPWNNVLANYLEGSIHQGKVARLTNFGAFVSLEEGVDGLIHISKLGGGRRINHPREVLENGQELEVKIEAVKSEDKRISLVLANQTAGSDSDTEGDLDQRSNFKQYAKEEGQQSSGSMGTFGDLLAAKLKK